MQFIIKDAKKLFDFFYKNVEGSLWQDMQTYNLDKAFGSFNSLIQKYKIIREEMAKRNYVACLLKGRSGE